MNKIFRFTGLAVFAAAVLGLSATQSLAQDPCADADAQTALYTKFTELYPKTDLASRKASVEAAKQFLEKYGACEPLKEQNDYFKSAIPAIEKLIKEEEEREADKKLFARYDTALESDNADELFPAGKAILAKHPENINIMIPMGIISLYKPAAKDKYADESIKFAQMALTDLKGGKPCNRKDKKTGAETCGVLKYELPRADAMSELTYSIAYLRFYAKNDKKGALPLYYELSQSSARYKDEPRLYATIGSYYVDESAPIGKEIVALIEKQKAAPTDEEKEKLDVDIKAKVALYNGYIERALDAFSRAYKFADEKIAAEKTLKGEVYKTLQNLYQRRFEKTEGLDAWISSTTTKPLPNPTSEVTPVTDPEPATTTTTTGATTPASAAPAAANGKTATAKPAAANGKTATTAKPKK